MNRVIGIHQFKPDKVWKWKLLEQKMAQVLSLHDYQEIRLSVLQDYTEIVEGITALMHEDEATQATEGIVSLSPSDGNLNLLTLRPEGTISVLHYTAQIVKDSDVHRFYYIGPMFRKGKESLPSEFHQLGVELLGSAAVVSENEVISLGVKICQQLGLRDVKLQLNSFGCQDCRPHFFEDLHSFLKEHESELCADCFRKLSTNPFADTGCTNSKCKAVYQEGPMVLDYLCQSCRRNFSKVKKIQANLAHQYIVNPKLFKNFAYYNETVFDFVIKVNGQEQVIGGGGRYDYLSRMITGKNIPAVGFYLNIDSIFETMERRGLFMSPDKDFSVFISTQSEDLDMMLLQIAQELHDNNIKTVLSTDKHSITDDIALAQKAQCELMLVIRDENVREGKLLMRDLIKEHQDYIKLDGIIDAILLARKSLNKE
ncbi:MAG: ATP phosphoribosyltransferase regulatory subunit [Candidatus Cloacimonetes bacterium]|nr:ATP phosphoribosyltransferase regulatory subunit [Candidatus Cloacimonadota bacterium]